MTSRMVDAGWGSEIEKALRMDTSEVLIVSPFIKASALDALLASSPASIRVVTRFSLDEFAQRVSDTTALRRLLEAGALVRGVRNLHAKLYVFGSSRAMVTSANLTGAGMGRNHEFGLATDEGGVVVACRDYFRRLWDRAGPDLTVDRLEGWETAIATWRAAGGRLAHPDRLADYGADIGLPRSPERAKASVFDEWSQAFVKFLGEGNDRAGLHRAVLEEVEGSGCHWALGYPARRRPRSVADGAVMFISRLVEGGDIRVFGRAIGVAHRDGRDDATQADIQRRPWKSDWPAYIRVHDGEFVDGTLSSGVSLRELMESLGPRCFASTARNAASGTGNTNPRLAIRQHPAVELSDEGAAWLARRLEHRLEVHGALPAATLRGLDWPAVPVAGESRWLRAVCMSW